MFPPGTLPSGGHYRIVSSLNKKKLFYTLLLHAIYSIHAVTRERIENIKQAVDDMSEK